MVRTMLNNYSHTIYLYYIADSLTPLPGYVGYIPAQKCENLYGKTYGKITYMSSTK